MTGIIIDGRLVQARGQFPFDATILINAHRFGAGVHLIGGLCFDLLTIIGGVGVIDDLTKFSISWDLNVSNENLAIFWNNRIPHLLLS